MSDIDFTQPPADVWPVPVGWTAANPRPTKCRSCGAEIMWCKTNHGTLCPVDPDGTVHFRTCPQADDWRKR